MDSFMEGSSDITSEHRSCWARQRRLLNPLSWGWLRCFSLQVPLSKSNMMMMMMTIDDDDDDD